MMIIFEGTDGSGKGTQAKKLLDYFLAKNKKAVLLDFPQYNTPTGKLIYEYLHGKEKLLPIDVAKLFYNDQLAQKNNLLNLQKNGIIIILDRYTLSTKVYQGANYEGKERYELMETVSGWQKNLPKDDLTIVFDLPVENSIERIIKRGRAMDNHEKNKEYLVKVHNLYIETAEKFNYPIIRCVANNHEKTVDEIFLEVLRIVKEKTGLIF
ncbi:MAG: dTMP kinase [Candidatus Nanoarchaeia archaeon]